MSCSNKQRQNHYHKAHVSAKVIVTALVVLLLLASRVTGAFVFDVAAVLVWFWGVNPIAHLIEKALHLRSKHDWV